ncbi:MAG: TolC family protein, partial [Candidatus Aminicenantes bacterium]|nr:TolC family protein [Candidatus Aminicenantes bacterium]
MKTINKRSPCPKTLTGLWICLLLLILIPSPVAAQEEILTLEQAVRMALSGNERALAADERVTAAVSRLSKARAYFMPSINVTGNYTRRPFEVQRTIGNQQIIVQSLNALSGVASFSMTIFDARSIPTLIQTSSDRSSEWYASAETKRGLSFEVSNAFLATLGVDQILEASRNRLDFARQNLEAAKARYAAGLVSSNDVTRA